MMIFEAGIFFKGDLFLNHRPNSNSNLDSAVLFVFVIVLNVNHLKKLNIKGLLIRQSEFKFDIHEDKFIIHFIMKLKFSPFLSPSSPDS